MSRETVYEDQVSQTAPALQLQLLGQTGMFAFPLLHADIARPQAALCHARRWASARDVWRRGPVRLAMGL